MSITSLICQKTKTQIPASTPKLNIAVIGRGFGAEFIPLWQKHPHTNCDAICQHNADKLREVGDYRGVEKRHTSCEEFRRTPQ